MEAIVVGAGIGGLATALFLHKNGIAVRVFEAAREIRELGVGINVLPHATRELHELSVLDDVVAAGVETRELVQFSRRGQRISGEARGRFAGYDWPQVSIHRGRFQRILYDAAKARIGADRIVTDRRFTGFTDEQNGVTARFTDHMGAETVARGDVLIACDGIHSRAREILYPDQGSPAYSGVMLWRGISRAKSFMTDASMVAIGHNTQKFIAYPITHPDADGEVTINWLAELPRAEMLRSEDWNRPGHLDDFYPQFESWAYDWLSPADIIRNAEGIFEFPMVDRDPVDRWSFGRVTLLGDAAHPMYPVGSNGSSQAILDASALARALATHSNPVDALKAYEEERLETTTKIVLAHRERAFKNAMETVEERAPEGFNKLEDVIAPEEIAKAAEEFKKIAGFDQATVNRPRSQND